MINCHGLDRLLCLYLLLLKGKLYRLLRMGQMQHLTSVEVDVFFNLSNFLLLLFNLLPFLLQLKLVRRRLMIVGFGEPVRRFDLATKRFIHQH